MPDLPQHRPNKPLWYGLLITVLVILSNVLSFLTIPPATFLWIILFLPVVGLVLLLIGLKRAFTKKQIYGGRIWGSLVTLLAVGILGLSVFGFIHARDLPPSTGAPKVGQKAPDFTLADTQGQSVSLSQLFSNHPGNSAPPKAVLLIFYRGYW